MLFNTLENAPNFEAKLEFEYQSLLNGLDWSDSFSLFFIDCSPAIASNIYARLATDLTAKTHYVLTLEQSIDNLYDEIVRISNIKKLDVLFIENIEKSFNAYIKQGYG
jgi:hypothetical protein